MTKVTFENATIRDVISKAARVAPTKGAAFDKANGILLVVEPDENRVVVRATNLEVFYMEIADVVSIEGDAATWLMPSVVLDGVCSKLPLGSGKNVTFDDQNGSREIVVKQSRMVVRMNTMGHTYYPEWDAFDPADLVAVSDFAGRVAQVQWAAAKGGNPIMTGVHMNGTHLMATNQFKLAVTPLEIPNLVDPITIPPSVVSPIAKSLSEVRVGVGDGLLLLQPDDSTQIQTVIFPGQFPPVLRLLTHNETHGFTTQKEFLLEMIEQAMVMGARDRFPLLKMIIGKEEVAVMMEDREIGLLGNVVEIPGMATHDRTLFGLDPTSIREALNACPNKEVSFYYRQEAPMKPIRIDGGSGFEAIVMPRSPDAPTGGDA